MPNLSNRHGRTLRGNVLLSERKLLGKYVDSYSLALINSGSMLQEHPSLKDIIKVKKSNDRKARRKAKRNKANRTEYQVEHGLGKWCMVKTMTGICPFNMGGTTTYLVGAGITCHAQKSKSGWWLYLTASYNIKDSKHINQLIEEKRIKRRVSARSHELSFMQPLPDFK